jgi:hypothetical protein
MSSSFPCCIVLPLVSLVTLERNSNYVQVRIDSILFSCDSESLP